MSIDRILLAAQGYLELEMPGEALAELDSLGGKDRDREEILQLRLFVLMRGRHWSRALGVCERLRQVYPEGSTGYIHGAFCLHELGRTAEAREILLSGPSSLNREATYYYNLGCYAAVLGNLEEATESLRLSFEMDDKFREIAKYDPDLKSVSGLFSSVSALPLSRVQAAFEANFSNGLEIGAAVSVWQDGKEVLNLCGGFCDRARQVPWKQETMVLIWSATKGMASACLLHAIDAAGLGLDTRIIEIWPEFGGGGKAGITLGQVLSHGAGLGALDRKDLSILDHAGVAEAIEQQVPSKGAPGHPGYGPRTFGFLADEIVRRLNGGIPLGTYWRTQFADPLELDLWIGLPGEFHHRVASVLPSKAAAPGSSSAFQTEMSKPDSLTNRAFSSPGGLLAVSAMNRPEARSASLPSMGGIGTASALAKFYAVLALEGVWQGRRYFGEKIPAWMSTRLSQGFDQVLQTETAFSAGFMMDPCDASGKKIRSLLGPSLRAFGHPGAGGSLGFADPEGRIGFGYVMNQMEAGVLPGARAQGLVDSLYSEIR